LNRSISLFRALRPEQWSKNAVVFAGALFSHTLTETDVLVRSITGFGAFCCLASAVYLLNDVRDREGDRVHPKKRFRPIASGEVSPLTALATSAVLLAFGLALSGGLGPTFLAVAVAYFALNIVYSLGAKRIVLLDVLFLALGFVLRAVAGVELIRPLQPDVALSPWLLVCTFFLALFLGFGKRRQEIASHSQRAEEQRAVLRSYSLPLLDSYVLLCAATTLVAYAIYTIWPATVAKVGSEDLIYTVPIVAYGLFRYLWLAQRRQEGEDPSRTLITDGPLLASVLLWAALAWGVLYLGK
jgi:4-hydroxybenzoate polyprenyltransferase